MPRKKKTKTAKTAKSRPGKQACMFRLSPPCVKLLERWAGKLGVSKTAVFEMSVRLYDEQMKLERVDGKTAKHD